MTSPASKTVSALHGVVIAVLFAFGGGFAQAGDAELRVRVLEEESGQPVDSAVVLIPLLSRGMVTGPDGVARLTALPGGRYRLHVEADRHERVITDPVLVRCGTPAVVTVRLPADPDVRLLLQDRPDLNDRVETALVQEPPSATFTLHVREFSSGELIEQVDVRWLGDFSAEVTPTEPGWFAVERPPFGWHTVAVSAPGYLPSCADIVLRPGDAQTVHLDLRKYWPTSHDSLCIPTPDMPGWREPVTGRALHRIGDAVWAELDSAGRDTFRYVPTYELHPPVPWAGPAGTGRISGRLIDKLTGEPFAGKTVFLPESRLQTQTGADGSFAFSNLKRPRYLLTAHPSHHGLFRAATVPVLPGMESRIDVYALGSIHTRRAGLVVDLDPRVLLRGEWALLPDAASILLAQDLWPYIREPRIFGYVQDESGEPLPGIRLSTASAHNAVSDTSGFFALTQPSYSGSHTLAIADCRELIGEVSVTLEEGRCAVLLLVVQAESPRVHAPVILDTLPVRFADVMQVPAEEPFLEESGKR